MLCWFSTTRQISYNYTYPHPLELPSSPTIASLQISQCYIATSPSLSILATIVCVLMLLCQFLPPSPSPTVSTSPVSVPANKYPLCVTCSDVSNSLQPYGLQSTRLLCPWNSAGKNTGVSCYSLLQGTFLTQGSNPVLLNCRQILSAELPGEHLHSFLENRFINFIFFLDSYTCINI